MYIKNIKNQVNDKINFISKCKTKTIFLYLFYQNKKYISFEPDGSPTLHVFVSRTLHQHSAGSVSVPLSSKRGIHPIQLISNRKVDYPKAICLLRRRDIFISQMRYIRRYDMLPDGITRLLRKTGMVDFALYIVAKYSTSKCKG